MLKLQTPVNLEPAPVSISYEDRILVLGSCFAAEIGQRLTDSAFQVLSNPFGTLYNPVSVGNALSRLASGIPFTGEDAVEMGAGSGRICSFSHHTSFARPTTEAFLEDANRSLEEACTFWKSCNKVIITLGTAWAFRFNGTGETVANCLKRPAAEFTRYRLSVSQVRLILEGLLKRNPDKEFIFTVSPIRHLADGAHGNQLSKSTLLLATEGLPYFPAYEIMMDELRDYRWWAEDMVHPSRQAAAYLCDRFMEWALPTREWDRYETKMKEWRCRQHRPFYSAEKSISPE
jgi:hypothetical protein